MDSIKVGKTLIGKVREAKDEMVIEVAGTKHGAPLTSTSLQDFIYKYMKPFDGKVVSITITLDIDEK